MTPQSLVTLLAGSAADLKRMIESGAQWEVSAHIAITNAIRSQTGQIPRREMKYAPFVGPEMGEEACDLVIQEGSTITALELKVESAQKQGTFAGLSLNKVTSLDEGVNWDVTKLSKLRADQFRVTGSGGQVWQPETLNRWILVIAWSARSIVKLQAKTGAGIFTDVSTGLMFWIAAL